MNKILGMKVYDNDWFLKFRFSYSEVAKILKDWGINLILTQSKYIPMPDTAVKSEVSEQEKQLYNSYNDLKFREALANEGIDYYSTILMFFDPSALLINEKLSPYDENLKQYLQEFKLYSRLKKKDAINTTARFTQKFHYDFLTIMNEKKGVDPRNYRLMVPIEYQFYRDNAQKQLIDSYVQRYGCNTIDSLGKILMKSGMMNLFRKVSPSSYSDVSL